MRTLLLANNWLGLQVLRWLLEQDEEVVGLVLHPPEKRKFGTELLECIRGRELPVFDGSMLREAGVLTAIRETRADVAVSVLFDYILLPEFLALFPQGVINLHPSYLPYNRGQYPNVWSIVEGTPAGVTLLYMDAGIDTGDIIARREVAVEPVDTGETLYRKLEATGLELFREVWPAIRSGTAPRIPQERATGTYHRTADVERIDSIDLDRTYSARELIDILRARTFPPYHGAYFRLGDRKIYIRLELIREEETEGQPKGNADAGHNFGQRGVDPCKPPLK